MTHGRAERTRFFPNGVAGEAGLGVGTQPGRREVMRDVALEKRTVSSCLTRRAQHGSVDVREQRGDRADEEAFEVSD